MKTITEVSPVTLHWHFPLPWHFPQPGAFSSRGVQASLGVALGFSPVSRSRPGWSHQSSRLDEFLTTPALFCVW